MPIRLSDLPGHRPEDIHTCGECKHGNHPSEHLSGPCGLKVRELIINSIPACNEGFEEIDAEARRKKPNDP